MQFQNETLSPGSATLRRDLERDTLTNVAINNSGSAALTFTYESRDYGSGAQTIAAGATFGIAGMHIRHYEFSGNTTFIYDMSYPEYIDPKYLTVAVSGTIQASITNTVGINITEVNTTPIPGTSGGLVIGDSSGNLITPAKDSSVTAINTTLGSPAQDGTLTGGNLLEKNSAAILSALNTANTHLASVITLLGAGLPTNLTTPSGHLAVHEAGA